MNCTILQVTDIGKDGAATVDRKKSLHLRDRLGIRTGDTILAGIVNGPIGNVTVRDDRDGHIIVDVPTGPPPTPHPVDLILAMPRPKAMKRLWAPLSSIGLRRITIIGAKHVEPFYFDSHAVAASDYTPRLIEGLEQARDTRLPEVTVVSSFDWFAKKHLAALPPACAKIIGHPSADQTVRTAVSSFASRDQAVVAVGPEGGWTNAEIETFTASGFVPCGMRDRALRTDTAVVSLLALVYDALGAE